MAGGVDLSLAGSVLAYTDTRFCHKKRNNANDRRKQDFPEHGS